MSQLIVHGGYFSQNFGDYLLIERVRRLAEEFGWDVVMPLAPRRVRQDFGLGVKGGIFSLCKAKKIVFAGGGYLGQRDHRVFVWSLMCLYRQVMIPLIARVFRIPYAYYGVEVGPLKYTFLKIGVSFALRGASEVYVRNEESYEFVEKLTRGKANLTLGTDLAQNLNYLNSYVNSESFMRGRASGCIGVHVTSILSRYSAYKELINNHLIELSRAGWSIVYFCDAPTYNEMLEAKDGFFSSSMDSLGSTQKIKYSDPSCLMSVISKLDMVITAKLHVGIVAKTFGAKVLSLPSHNKTVKYYRHINQLESCLYDVIDEADGILRVKCFFEGAVLKSIQTSLPEKILKLEEHTFASLRQYLAVSV